jgi:hypothetical protein
MEMDDTEFAQLQLRATICPHQARWPAPELLHWRRLHATADEARERVRKACMQMDEIDRNAVFSRDDKYRQRSKTAAQAIADFEASKTLARAREAVDSVIQQWKRGEQHVSTEIAEATLKAMKEAEAGWQRAIDLISERACLTKSPAPDWRAAKFRPHPVTSW